MQRLLPLIFMVLASLSTHLQAQPKRVAMLISSYGDESRPELSYDLEELAQAYLVLTRNGIEIDILSPEGGPVLVKTNKDDLPFIQAFKQQALPKLENTIATRDAKREAYDAVFIIGGSGAMMDLPYDHATQQLLTQFANDSGIIVAVCHGPAAIANIKMADGSYYVRNKRVTSFTNVEDKKFKAESISKFEFLNEDKLNEHGGLFVSNAPMLPFVAVDGDLITAQNPSSVPKAAEALVIKLGLPLQSRELFKDEATMRLLAEARSNGSAVIDIALASGPEKYDLNYLALYGFYAYQLASSDKDKGIELSLMETIANHFQHPAYEAGLIQALTAQGFAQKAAAAYETFLTRYPQHESLPKLRSLLGVN